MACAGPVRSPSIQNGSNTIRLRSSASAVLKGVNSEKVALPVLTSNQGMPANYSIRLASAEHLKAIPGIQVAAVSVFAESDVPLDIRYRTTAADVLQDAQESARLWVATDGNDHVVGYAMIEIFDGLAHLDDLDVHPEHARQGIGSALLRVVIDWAMREQYTAMTLVTFRHLAWNAPFYEKFGFSEIKGEALNDDLRELLQDEVTAGLSGRHRIGMQLSLTG